MKWWIDVNELLPAVGRMVNVRNSYTTQVARRAADGQFYAQYIGHTILTIRIDGVTHWAVIPDISYEV